MLQAWEEILNTNASQQLSKEKTRKMKKMVRKFGIPEHLRARVCPTSSSSSFFLFTFMQSWVAVTGARDKLIENVGMYDKLVEDINDDSVHMVQIDKVL